MFNSREYEFADMTVMVGGKDTVGLRGLKYSAKQEKEVLYGKGNEPIAIQKGNKSYEGELTILPSELETLRLNGDGTILGLQVDIVVVYGNPLQGDVMVTDVLQGVQFTEEPKEYKQGDKFAEITLPFIFLRLKKAS
ncbi:MAG: hypothetical protein J5708_05715 [Bacteroidales bacterium]|nr:hypothetical protein [Bacteroidales bacterium]